MTTVVHRDPPVLGSLLGRGLAYSIATAVQGAVAVLALPAVTRSLDDADEYGAVTAVLVVIQLVGTFATLGLPAALTREYFVSKDARKMSARLVGSTAVAASLIALIVHATGPWWSNVFASLSYERALQLGVAAIVPTALLVAGQALLRCRERAVAFVIATIVGTAGAQLLGLVFLWTGEGSAERFLLGYVLAVGLGAAIAVVGSGVKNLQPASRAMNVSALKLGVPTLPHVVAFFLIVGADRVVVERYEGLAAAGRYQFTYLLGIVGVSLLVAVNNAWVPMVYAVDATAERWRLLASTSEALLRLAVPIVWGLSFGAPVLLRLAAPASFSPEALTPVLALTAASLVPYVMYLSAAMTVFYERRSGLLALITPSVAIVNLVANVLVVPGWGMVGAAGVSLVSYCLLAVLTLTASRRLVFVPWNWDEVVRTTAVAAAGVSLAILLPTDGGWLVLRCGLTVGCVAMLFVLARRAVRG